MIHFFYHLRVYTTVSAMTMRQDQRGGEINDSCRLGRKTLTDLIRDFQESLYRSRGLPRCQFDDYRRNTAARGCRIDARRLIITQEASAQ